MNGHHNNTTDTLVRATAADGRIRCMAAVTTQLVADATTRHGTSPTIAAALGRTLTGALLLGAGLKEFDRLTVQISGDGPAGGITAEANARGQVRDTCLTGRLCALTLTEIRRSARCRLDGMLTGLTSRVMRSVLPRAVPALSNRSGEIAKILLITLESRSRFIGGAARLLIRAARRESVFRARAG